MSETIKLTPLNAPSDVQVQVSGERVQQPAVTSTKKDFKFWLIFFSMCITLFLSALEYASVATALPTIAGDLHASQFAWVGSAFALSSTAFLPMSGGLAQAFGRRPAILVTIGIFALGSGICGGAKSMNMLIAGRTVQGLGGGGIKSITGIILADIVTLRERGVYSGVFGVVWCLAVVIGPVVGGSLASQGQWRWLFYLNLPISLVACLSVIFFLDLPTPPGSWQQKFMRMDWIGNFLVISSTAAYMIGLTWGGITAPWGSASVLTPLILGLLGLVGFIAYEATLAKLPLVPFSLMTNITSMSGYIQTFFSSVATWAVFYFLPVYYQGCKGSSAVKSGVYTLGLASLAPAVILVGVSVKATKRYRPQMWFGWAMIVIPLALMTKVEATDPIAKFVGYSVMLGIGIGVLYATTMYPIQAPIPVTRNAPALAFMWFVRSLAGVWGLTIGSTVLQNELSKKLPASFVQSLPQGTGIMYSLIPEINSLSPQLRAEVQAAFASSLAVLWEVMAILAGIGFLSSLAMQGLPLHESLDKDWSVKNKGR